MEGKALRLINPDTGEITERACPNCAAKEILVEEVTRKLHGALSQLGHLRAETRAKYENHELWGWGVTVFQEWKVATGHYRAVWTHDRFDVCKGALETHGFADCRYAIWGLAANCFEKEVTPTFTRRYDEFWRVFGPSAGVQSADHFEAHVNEGRAIFGADLPVCEWDRILHLHRGKR